MKTLYWNRIQIFNESDAIWFTVNEADLDETDFAALFAKQPNASAKSQQNKNGSTSKKSDKLNHHSKMECVKLLESKRSQAIGILMTSKRLDYHTISDALLHFDNQLLSFETLSSIYALRPTEDELKTILDYVKQTVNI